MCSNCNSPGCTCTGGNVFNVCPCTEQYALACNVCGHSPATYATDVNPEVLNELVASDVTERERAAFESQQ